jgi:hypothetical protein
MYVHLFSYRPRGPLLVEMGGETTGGENALENCSPPVCLAFALPQPVKRYLRSPGSRAARYCLFRCRRLTIEIRIQVSISRLRWDAVGREIACI